MRKLKLFMAAAALMLGGGMTASAQVEPTNGGGYYIYNAENDLFFTRGADWGTQAFASPMGIPWKVEITDGNYTLKMYDINTQNSADVGLGFNGAFTDNDSPIALTPSGNATDGYTLKNGDNYITCPASTGAVSMTTTSSTWKFLTQAQYDAVLAARAASQESNVANLKGITIPEGKTLSDVVTDANNWATTVTNDGVPTKALWPMTGNANRNGAYNEGTYGIEEFQTNAAHITKTITGLKAGIYKVTVRGMKRMGTNGGSVALENASFYVSDAYVNANGNIIPVKAWAADNTADAAPNGPAEVVSIIENGGYTTEGFVYVGTDGNLTVDVVNEAFWWGGWMVFNGISYTYYNDVVADEDATEILSQATTLEGQEMDAAVLANLTAAKNTFNSARTIANYNALQTAIDAAKASADAYALFAPERIKALALGMTADAIAALAPDVQALKVAEYTFVTTNYSNGVELGTWTTTGETATNKGQHWDGTTTSTYLEQLNRGGDNPTGWNASAWAIGYNQNVELPSGNYVFKVAGRRSSTDVTLSLVVKNGETELGTVNDFPLGDTGKGIDVTGATNYGDGTYANNNIGRGWEWRYVKFTLDQPATVNIAVTAETSAQYQWISFSNPTVQTDDADNVALMEALVALNDAKAAATLTKRTNVGTGVFQFVEATDNSLWEAYNTAKTNAENFTFTAATTTAEVEGLATALTTALDAYNNNDVLVAPAAGARYYLTVATAGHDKEGNAVVVSLGEAKDNNKTGYGFAANASPAPHAAGAYIFTKCEGNNYKISTERPEGTVYLTYGSLNNSAASWATQQIQGTTDASAAGEFKIVASATAANVFNIFNTVYNDYIDCQDSGSLYTDTNIDKKDFKLVEASQATVNLTIAANVQYATRIFPFVPTLPEGVVAYSCDAVSETNVTMKEVTTLEANKPYILFAENGVESTDLTGWGLATADTYTEGLLTGVYVLTDAPVGSYVLQNNADGVGFYKVAEGKQPKVGAYRAYLQVPAAPEGVRETYFFGGEKPTGIEAIDVLTSGKAEIFNAAGARVPALQKGLNIVRKADGTSYKVIVK